MSTSTCATAPVNCAPLQIFSVLNAVPARTSFVSIPSSVPAEALAYRKGFAYLGFAKTAGRQEFQSIDVHDPNAPRVVSGKMIGHGVNAIDIHDSTAYLGTDDNSTSGKAIVALDLSNQQNPSEISSFHFPGAGFVRVIAAVGSYLYSGRSYAIGTSEEFSILHHVIPLTRAGGVDIGTSAAHRGVYAILVRDFLAFLLTNDQLQLWDVHDAAHPIPYSFLALPHGSATSMTCWQNTLYIGSIDIDGSGYLTLVTSS
jgi:hypothetical protein